MTYIMSCDMTHILLCIEEPTTTTTKVTVLQKLLIHSQVIAGYAEEPVIIRTSSR